MGSPPPPSADRVHIRLVERSGRWGNGRVAQAALLSVLWIAIVWLLFASFVDTGRDNRTNTPPPATQPVHQRGSNAGVP